MSNRFLSTSGSGNTNLTNGSADLFINSLGISNLNQSMPLKTNASREIITSKLDQTDINNLQTDLNLKGELSYTKSDTHSNPPAGQIKTYFKTDGEFYKKDENGTETVFGSAEKLILVEKTTDIDYSDNIKFFTYSDNTLNTHNFYDYTSTPVKPDLRQAFEPIELPTNVASEAELDTAISTEAKNIVITASFPITTQKVIGHSCKISQSSGLSFASSVDTPFTITGDNTTIDGLQIINDRTSSIVSCLKFNNLVAINNTVKNCIFTTNEFAIVSDNAQIQIHNCQFKFTGTADSHRYIHLTKTTGKTLIYSNTFQSNGAFSTACMLVNGTAINYKDGSLIVYNNSSTGGTIQRMGIMEMVPDSNFTLSFIKNTIETFTDFFILYVGSNPLAGFKEIILHRNNVSLVAGSTGFKGLIGIDSFTTGININTSTIIKGSQNTLPTSFRTDYNFIPQSSASNPLMMYRPDKFNLSITPILINPPLVSYYQTDNTQNTSLNVEYWARQQFIARKASAQNQWDSVVYSPEKKLWVATAVDGTINNQVMTSYDGINWTNQTIPVIGQWRHVAWSSGLGQFCAVGSINPRIMTSSDGINWSIRSVPELVQYWCVEWIAGLNIWVACGDTRVITSHDGITWTNRYNSLTITWLCIAYSNRRIVIAGTGGSVITSENGSTWTPRTSGNTTDWTGMTYSDDKNLFVAVGDTGSTRHMYSSDDGITWTTKATPENNNWKSVIWAKTLGIFVAVSQNGTQRKMISVDGINWTARYASEDNLWYSLGYNDDAGLIVGVASSGTYRVFTFPDSGIGNVLGPSSSTDNAIVCFNGSGGDAIKNSLATVDVNGDITARNITLDDTGGGDILANKIQSTSAIKSLSLVNKSTATGAGIIIDASTQGNIKLNGTSYTGGANKIMKVDSTGVVELSNATLDSSGNLTSYNILPASDNAQDIGTSDASYRNIYIKGDVFKNGTVIGGTGDVVGPPSSTIGELCWFSTATGKRISPTSGISTNGSGLLQCQSLVSTGIIQASDNNFTISQIRCGDASYAYIAEYGTNDSDSLYLYGSAAIYSNTSISNVSDRNYKKNINPYVITEPLDKVNKLSLKSFNYIDSTSKNGAEKKHIGYIAQDVEEVYDEAVEKVSKFKTDTDGKYLLDDNGEKIIEEKYHLTPYYITLLQTEAIKELTKKCEELTKRVQELENKI